MSQRPKRTPSKPLRYRRDLIANLDVGGVQVHNSVAEERLDQVPVEPVVEEPVNDASVVPDKITDAKWGELCGVKVRESVLAVYEEVTRWNRNVFYLPSGKAGENFIEELTRLVNLFNSGGAFESVSLMMVSIIFPLLLQKPSANSKSSDHVRYLEKRLLLWKEGNLEDLLSEGKTIQTRLTRAKRKADNSEQRFVHLMEDGKVSAALRCIGSLQCSVHQITADVLETLNEKHPPGQNAEDGSLIQGPFPKKLVETVIFDSSEEVS